MEIKKVNIKELLHSYSKINIPFYQREYVWTEKETKKFLEDIMSSMSNEYYIGSIVMKSDNFKSVIIDGQQRISTIWMIIKALETNSLYLNEKDINTLKENLAHFQIDPRNLKNGEILKKIIKDSGKTLSEDEKQSNYFLNFYFIKNFFNSYCGMLDKFIKNFNSVVVSFVGVEKEVDEQILFSQINSTGKKLSAFDLVRNKLFATLQDDMKEGDTDSELFDEQLNEKLKIFDESFQLDNTNRKEIENDEIIRHFISYKNGKLCKNDSEKIYYEFESLFSSSYSNKGFRMFEELCNFAIVYNFLRKGYLKANYKFNDSLELLGNSFKTYVVLLVDIFLNNSTIKNFNIEKLTDKQENIIYECFMILENYKIRREFCAFEEKTITRFIPTVSQLIQTLLTEFKNLNYPDCLFYILFIRSNNIKFDNGLPTYRAPLSQEFHNSFITCNIYLHRKFCKNFLIRISKNKTKIDFENFTIDHIMPQDLKKWKADGYDCENEEIITYKNTIGNLTLTPYNSEYSNETFAFKVSEMKKNESFVLNNYFLNLNKWDVDEIKKRANHLFELVDKIWQFDEYFNKMNEMQNSLENYLKNLPLVRSNDYPYEKQKEIIKNKSHFYKIGKITKEQIHQLIENYCKNGISLEENELLVFKGQYKGYVNMSINRFLSIGESLKKFATNEKEIKKFIDSKSDNIDDMLRFIDNI